jgi:hypothetical protein
MVVWMSVAAPPAAPGDSVLNDLSLLRADPTAAVEEGEGSDMVGWGVVVVVVGGDSGDDTLHAPACFS